MYLRRNTRFLLGITLGLLALVLSQTTDNTCAEEGIIVCRGETVTIGATLLQNGTYGNPVPNQQIEFFDQTHNLFLASALTSLSGEAIIEWAVPASQPLGANIINATFRGNQSLALSSSCQWTIITILSHTDINIQVERDTLAPEDTLTFTTSLLNDRGDALPNARVAVLCGTVRLQSGITNATGHVDFAIICNGTWGQLGTNRIRVVHERDMFSFSETAEVVFNVSIQQLPSSLTLVTPPQNQIRLNENLRSYIVLKTNGIALPGAQLEVLLDGTSFDYLSTNGSGAAFVDISIDSRFSLGGHELAVRYPGTSRYLSCFLELQMTIVSPSLVRLVLPELVTTGTEANLTLEVSDLIGRPLSGAFLNLRDITTSQVVSELVPVDAVLMNIVFQVTGKEGARRFVLDIVGNDFISNRSYAFDVAVWVRPEIIIVYSDIIGYAYPGQEFLMELHLGDFDSDYVYTPVGVHNGNISDASMLTNQSGVLVVRFAAPRTPGLMTLLFTYPGNPVEYRLATTLCYTVIVTERMPAVMSLFDYQIISPLQQIYVRLLLRALNGSHLVGVIMNYEWLSSRGVILSGQGGIIEMHLPFPSHAGSFNLSYWIETSRFLLFSSGYTIISLDSLDMSSIEGVGIIGFAISACLSVLIVSIPAVRRRYLLD